MQDARVANIANEGTSGSRRKMTMDDARVDNAANDCSMGTLLH